jgi:hypothetical protein
MSQEPEESPSQKLTSLQSTPTGLGTDRSPPSDRLVRPLTTIEPSSKGAAALESQLEGVQAERKIERFFWILAVVILSDCVIFKFVILSDCVIFKFEDAWTSNTFVGLLSLVLLIGCARWLEVPWVYIPLVRIFNKAIGDRPSPPGGERAEED